MSAADGRAPSAWAVREPADREPDLSDPGSHREHRRDLALIAPALPGRQRHVRRRFARTRSPREVRTVDGWMPIQ